MMNAVSAAKHREVPLSHLLRDSLHHLCLKNRNGPNPCVIGGHGERFSSRRGLVAKVARLHASNNALSVATAQRRSEQAPAFYVPGHVETKSRPII
jgi:hypothetical protein